MLIAKQFDPILGIDVHFTVVGPGVILPMPTPFIGMVLDLFAWLPYIGTTVYSGGLPTAQAGTAGRPIPFHFPIGVSFGPPPPGNEAEIFMGSSTVVTDGEPQARMGVMVLSCQSIGMVAPFRMKKKKKAKSFFLPTSILLSLPSGAPVMVGGPLTVSLTALAMRGGMFAGGKAFKRWVKPSARYQRICARAHALLSRATKRLPANARNRVHRALCRSIGHPVDVGSGKVYTERTDFVMNGPIPLVWERVYYSTSDYEGPLGHGWHHAYDLKLSLDRRVNTLQLRLADGRLVGFHRLAEGQESYLQQEQLTLKRSGDHYILTGADYLNHLFDVATVEGGGEAPLLRIEHATATIDFTYNEDGHLRQIKDSGNRILPVTTDAHGCILQIEAPHPGDNYEGQTFPIVRYEYDALGDLTHATDPEGYDFNYAYRNHLLTQETNRNGLSFYFEYDGEKGGEAWCTRTWGDDGIHANTIVYDKEAQTATVTNSLGAVTRYFYNDNGLVYKTIDALGHVAKTHYGFACNVVRTTDEIQRVTNFEYDEFSNLTKVEYPDKTETTMQYEGHQLIMAVDQNGGAWTWAYNDRHQLIQRNNSEGEITEFEYAGPNLTAVIDPLGNRSELHYTDEHNLGTFTTPDGSRSQYKYDRLGRQVTAVSATGTTSRVRLNFRGDALKVWEADGNIRTIRYDGEENPIHIKDKQREVILEYKGMSHLSARTENNTRVEFKRDTEEDLVGIINEHGYAFRFKRNKRGEVVAEKSFDGLAKRFVRNPAGEVSAILKPGNSGPDSIHRIDYDLDILGRTTAVNYWDGTRHEFDYRADGQLMSAKVASAEKDNKGAAAGAEVRYERDRLGRVTTEFQGDYFIKSTYDKLGNRSKFSSSLGSTVRVKRNKFGDVLHVDHEDRNRRRWRSSFTRDDLGLEIERQLPGGVKANWERDRFGRPTRQTTSVGSRVVHDRTYGWGLDNRLKALSISGEGAFTYEHDPVGNLARATYPDGTTDLRMPDEVGNLFRTEARDDREYGPAGQLLRSGKTRYEYDHDGNLIRKHNWEEGEWRYDWSAAGMLTKVTRPDGDAIDCTYDALGRRTSKTYRGAETYFVWDGNVPLHEWVIRHHYVPKATRKLMAHGYVDVPKPEPEDVPPGDIPTWQQPEFTTWLFEPGSFAPLAKFTPENQYGILTDHLGTPIGMYDGDGNEHWSLTTDIYGAAYRQKGWTHVQPFRYPGQYWDFESGLTYNRFRYYDSSEGVYLSRDPIGLAGGNPTLYGYVGDVNGVFDPFGLSCEDFYKKGGGRTDADFITEHSKKHRYDPDRISTKNRSQFGEDMDVKKLREDTMKNADSIDKKIDDAGNHYATKYSKDYDFNVSTKDTPTGKHRVFINETNPSRSSQFPYVPRN